MENVETKEVKETNEAKAVKKPVPTVGIMPSECSLFQAFVLHYLTIIFPLIVVCSQRQRQNVFLRFYAFQAIYMYIATLIISAAGGILVGILMGISMISGPGWFSIILMILVSLALSAFSLAIIVFLIIASIKAYNGKIFKIPLVGNMAEKSANKYAGANQTATNQAA